MNKTLLISLAVALVVGGFLGYAIAPKGDIVVSDLPLGATNPSSTVISYYAALNKKVLWDALNEMWTDVVRRTASLDIVTDSASSVSWGTLLGAVSSTAVLIENGATIGDLVFVQPAVALVSGSSSVRFYADITATGTTNASATIYAYNTSSSVAMGNMTMNLTILSRSTFIDAPAIRVTTSTNY